MFANAKSSTENYAYDHMNQQTSSIALPSLSYVYIKILINCDIYSQRVWAVVRFAQSTTNFQMEQLILWV